MNTVFSFLSLFRTGLRSRTLIRVRWIAIILEISVLFFATQALPLTIAFEGALGTIAAAAVLNLFAFIYHRVHTLENRDAFLYLAFDVLQYSAFLYLTGGIENPFALLMVAPMAVSGFLLPARYTFYLSALAVLCVAAMTFPYFSSPAACARGGALVLACGLTALYVRHTADEARKLGAALQSAQLSLMQQQKISSLGAQAAATAHELGSPLNTITLIARTLKKELSDMPHIRDDAALLSEQAERCKTILQDFAARRFEAHEHDIIDPMVPADLITAIAEPHQTLYPDIDLIIETFPETGSEKTPLIAKTPEMTYGIGNLIQNALQHAEKRIVVACAWDRMTFSIAIQDDGAGFPEGILRWIKTPQIPTPKPQKTKGNMGLGLFISWHLLTASGGDILLKNTPRGGYVSMTWQRVDIDRIADIA